MRVGCYQGFASLTMRTVRPGQGSETVLLSACQPSCAGVKLILTPITTALFAAAGMLSSDGRCKTLSAAADGFGRGEACVTLMLQLHGSGGETAPAGHTPGAAGKAHGLLLLKGTAVGQDGRSSSLTAPNGPAQQATMASALMEAMLQGQARMALALLTPLWQNLVYCDRFNPSAGVRVGLLAF